MSVQCDICGKIPQVGHNVSHSHRRTSRRWLPNLQPMRIVKGKTVVRAKVCCKCLKAGKVQRPAPGARRAPTPA